MGLESEGESRRPPQGDDTAGVITHGAADLLLHSYHAGVSGGRGPGRNQLRRTAREAAAAAGDFGLHRARRLPLGADRASYFHSPPPAISLLRVRQRARAWTDLEKFITQQAESIVPSA